MKFALAIVLVGLVFGDDNACHKQLVAVHDCVVKKHDQNKAADDKKIEDAKAEVAKCFTKVGCKGPDFSGNSGPGGQIQKTLDSQPETVKECIKKDFKTAALSKLNECLSQNHVKEIQDSEMNDYDVFGDRSQADAEKMGKIMVAVMMAMQQCQKADQVMACAKPIHDKCKADMCKRVSDCKVEAKVSDACKKRGQEIKDAICKCQVDKMKAAKVKIEELQKKGGDVDMDDMHDIQGEGMGGPPGGPGGVDFDKIEKCYNDNNVTPPPFLAFAKSMASGQNDGPLAIFKASKPKITQAQLKMIHDGLDEKIKNPECGC